MAHCDGCGKDRQSVVSCGRDANGDPDAPDLCFLCRKQSAKGKVFDTKTGKYVWAYIAFAEAEQEAFASEPRPAPGDEDEIPF